MQKHNILICLDHVTGQVWITYRPLKKKTRTVWKWKAAGGWELACGLWWGNSATHASLLFSRYSREKKARDCYQLPFCVVLTLLQLSHQVVVLEESVAAECACEQHLEKKNSRSLKPRHASRPNTMQEAVQSTECHHVSFIWKQIQSITNMLYFSKMGPISGFIHLI